MSFIKPYKDDPFSIDAEAAEDLGKDLAEAHASAAPFPHTVIDNFLPQAVIEYCQKNFPQRPGKDSQTFDRDQERWKTSYSPDDLEPGLRAIFYTFNSRPFIRAIENITGINGLIPDPYFLGAGFHEIGTGGHLSVHVDFNHHKQMDLERRVNILIYLNDDWKPEYGGQLELWNEDMTECVQSVVPVANRAAMFTLSKTSYHGNPQPVAHPEGKTRRSIALYYYTATWDHSARDLTTQFKVRKGSDDKTDWQVKSQEFMQEYLPPFISRRAIRLAQKMRK